MSVLSAIRFRNYILREQRGNLFPHKLVALRMKRPIRGVVVFRETGSDLATFDEIVVQEIYRPVIEYLPDFRTVIDLGANIGLASLYFAAFSPSCRIFAVEPHPRSHELLVRNLGDLIRFGRCSTLNAAVWATETGLTSDSKHSPDRYSSFTLYKPSPGGNDKPSIQGLDMSTILERSGFETVDLLKVDIEGAEAELFGGALEWLNKVNAIAIEFHGDTRTSCRFDDIMRRYNFKIREGHHTILAFRNSEAIA